MGRASPLLSPRVGAFAALAAIDVAYYALCGHLWTMALWPNIAWLALVVIPAVLGLVLLALPLWRRRGLLPLALAFGALAAGFQHEGIRTPADFCKLASMALLAWWLLAFFESLALVVLVACIIPFVDAYSVWKGPTHHIVTQQQGLFSSLSVAFPVPGERTVELHWDAPRPAPSGGYLVYRNGKPLTAKPQRQLGFSDGSVGTEARLTYTVVAAGASARVPSRALAVPGGQRVSAAAPDSADPRAPAHVRATTSQDAANLGLPDLLFFSLFLAASVRFGLRRRWTWLATTASVGATMALAIGFDVGGLPALPLLSLGFLLPNADLVWRRLRPR